MWRMIWEFKSKILVTLCKTVEGEELCHQFWPVSESDTVNFGSITVTLQSSINFEEYEVRKFILQVKYLR